MSDLRRLRPATVFVLAIVLLMALPGTASAGRILKYRGQTSAGDGVAVRVLRRDNGRLFMPKLAFERLVFSCDVGEGDEFGIAWVSYPGRRLAEDRSFAITESGDLIAGRLRWLHGEGTLEMSYNQDGGTCTTGELSWSVERIGSVPDPHGGDRSKVRTPGVGS